MFGGKTAEGSKVKLLSLFLENYKIWLEMIWSGVLFSSCRHCINMHIPYEVCHFKVFPPRITSVTGNPFCHCYPMSYQLFSMMHCFSTKMMIFISLDESPLLLTTLPTGSFEFLSRYTQNYRWSIPKISYY